MADQWIECTIPPTTNNLFASFGKRRVKTPDYNNWLSTTGFAINVMKLPKISGAYELSIRLPDKMRGDIDNRIKALSDLLVELGVVTDDSLCRKITVERHEKPQLGKCHFMLTAAPVRSVGEIVKRVLA